ncbi:MAG: hypothetical protein Q9168_002931 [Polycauliona sp. 1 TL-2023]
MSHEHKPFWIDPDQAFNPRKSFAFKPSKNDINGLLEIVEAAAAKLFKGFIQRVKDKYPITTWREGGELSYEQWLFKVVNIDEEERHTLIMAEWIKLHLESVLKCEDMKRAEDQKPLHQEAKNHLDKDEVSD